MPPVSAEVLRRLATRVSNLTKDRRSPELFFENRSDIAIELRRLARGVEIATQSKGEQ